MSDTYARVMKPADEPGKRRATRAGAGRRSGAAASLAAAPAPAERVPAGSKPTGIKEPPAASAESPAEATFAVAAATFMAGRDAHTGHGFSFEDVPAPKRLAPYASAIAATVERDGADVAWGRLVLLYDPDGQEGWDGVFRLVAYIRADVEAEMAADPLLGEVGWSWLSEALDAHVPGYAVPSGTVTRVITEGFGAKRDELPLTGFELRASWCPAPSSREDGADLADELSGAVVAWCELLAAAAGLPAQGTVAIGVRPGNARSAGPGGRRRR